MGVFFCQNSPVSRRLLVTLILLTVLAALGGLYFYFRSQINSWIEQEILKRQEVPREETYCPDGEIYENSRQGYKVCNERGWSRREFGYSQPLVGFDPQPIPTASEYGGMITVSAQREKNAELLADYLSNLTDPTTVAATVGGVLGIKVTGRVPAKSEFFANYFQIYTVFEKFGRTYVITLLSNPTNYENNVLLYENFVAGFKFLAEVPSVPWGRDIYLASPWAGDEVSGSVIVAGEAQGAFENTLVARLKDEDGNLIFQKPITYTAAEMGQLGYFDVKFTFQTESPRGVLEVYHTSAMDGAIIDLVAIPLTFK